MGLRQSILCGALVLSAAVGCGGGDEQTPQPQTPEVPSVSAPLDGCRPVDTTLPVGEIDAIDEFVPLKGGYHVVRFVSSYGGITFQHDLCPNYIAGLFDMFGSAGGIESPSRMGFDGGYVLNFGSFGEVFVPHSVAHLNYITGASWVLGPDNRLVGYATHYQRYIQTLENLNLSHEELAEHKFDILMAFLSGNFPLALDGSDLDKGDTITLDFPKPSEEFGIDASLRNGHVDFSNMAIRLADLSEGFGLESVITLDGEIISTEDALNLFRDGGFNGSNLALLPSYGFGSMELIYGVLDKNLYELNNPPHYKLDRVEINFVSNKTTAKDGEKQQKQGWVRDGFKGHKRVWNG